MITPTLSNKKMKKVGKKHGKWKSKGAREIRQGVRVVRPGAKGLRIPGGNPGVRKTGHILTD
jgi:hypothetical protein